MTHLAFRNIRHDLILLQSVTRRRAVMGLGRPHTCVVFEILTTVRILKMALWFVTTCGVVGGYRCLAKHLYPPTGPHCVTNQRIIMDQVSSQNQDALEVNFLLAGTILLTLWDERDGPAWRTMSVLNFCGIQVESVNANHPSQNYPR